MSNAVTPRKPEEATLPSFKRILLVTDFSSAAEVAVPFARRLADLYEPATVFVSHILPEPELATAGEPVKADKAEQERQAAEGQMEKLLKQNSFGEAHVETVIRQGSVAEVVGSIIEEKKVDVLVVGTHGRSGVGKLLLGSVAQRIFNTASCPVLSVSPRARRSWGDREKLARILYATDFSTDSLHALPYALSLSRVTKAELLLLNVLNAPANEPIRDSILKECHTRLNALIPRSAQRWCKSDALAIPGDAADVILQTAAEQNAGLIVIGAHRVEGRINVPLSTAYRVVAHAHCPVLRVRSNSTVGES